MAYSNNFSKAVALSVGVLATAFLIGFIVLAWTEPTQAPPGGNVPAPINVGSTAQTKAGALTVTTLTTSAGKLYLDDTTEGDIERVNAVIGYNDLFLKSNSAENAPVYVSGSQLRFYSGGVERWRIDSTGSLVIGSVPWQRLTSFPSDCPSGQYVYGAGSTLKCSTPAGGGDITAVYAGTGLTGGGTSGDVTLSADTTYLQRRVTGTCAPGSSIRVINADGTVTCEIDDVGAGGCCSLYDTTHIGATTDLTITTAGLNLNGLGNEGDITRVDEIVGYNDLFLKSNSAENAPVYVSGSQLRFYSGGVERWRIDSTGSLVIGSVPWQRLTSFPSDCPSGQYVYGLGGTLKCAAPPAGGIGGSGTANYVAKFTAATTIGNSIIYDNGTNVGIGTTNPTQKLDVIGGVNATMFCDGEYDVCVNPLNNDWLHVRNKANNAYRGLAAYRLYIGQSGTYTSVGPGGELRIQDGLIVDGNVGIGTTNPGAKLHVAGNMKIDGTNTLEFGAGVAGKEVSAGKIGYQTFTSDALDIVGAGTLASNRKIKFWNEGGAFFNGNVGIGTTNPSAKLDVVGNIEIDSWDSQLWQGYGAGGYMRRSIGGAHGWDSGRLYINGWNDWSSGVSIGGGGGSSNLTVTGNLDVGGKLRIATSGNPYTFFCGTTESGVWKSATINYGTTFSSKPVVIVTPEGYGGHDWQMRDVTTTSFTIWMYCYVGHGEFWYIHWIALGF